MCRSNIKSCKYTRIFWDVTAQSARCCVTHWPIASLLELLTRHSVTILSTTAQLEINNLSSMTTAIYQTGGSWGKAYNFNWIFLLSTHLVSRSCCARLVTNVDFKLCRSRKDGHRVWIKVESSRSEAKIVWIGAERKKNFSSWLEKGTNGLSFFPLERKIE